MLPLHVGKLPRVVAHVSSLRFPAWRRITPDGLKGPGRPRAAARFLLPAQARPDQAAEIAKTPRLEVEDIEPYTQVRRAQPPGSEEKTD
ncbi:hypothetical protein [Streptomyces sp. NPDC003710]